MDVLAPLVGDWTVTASIAEPGAVGRASFAWSLDGRFLVQRTTVERSAIPDSLAVIAAAAEGEGFTQHYFDSRGVVRLYAMAFRKGVWTLLRERPDFSPFEFAQRFVGRLSEDGDAIDGRWDKRALDVSEWDEDFLLHFARSS
jgi:hypothetical protein